MKLLHVNCGGQVDSSTRTCDKCQKKWNPVSFLVTPKELRVLPVSPYNEQRKEIKPLTKEAFVNKLPHWPRWARILTVVIILAIFVGLIIFIRSR